MKLWLDDIREMPVGYDYHAKSVNEAIKVMESNKVEFISFDHDLGGKLTGHDLAIWIERLAFLGKIQKMGWDVHSANPVGAENIRKAMRNADRFWDK